MDGIDDAGAQLTPTRRFGRRLVGLVLGLALPIGFFTWLLGFDPIKKRVNGRLWCSDADDIQFDVKLTRSGGSTNSTDTLICRKNGAVVRTVGDFRMLATNIGVALVISLLLVGLLVICLLAYSRLRRRGRPAGAAT